MLCQLLQDAANAAADHSAGWCQVVRASRPMQLLTCAKLFQYSSVGCVGCMLPDTCQAIDIVCAYAELHMAPAVSPKAAPGQALCALSHRIA